MRNIILVLLAAMAGTGLGALGSPAASAPLQTHRSAELGAVLSTELSAQRRPRYRRSATRIFVYPAYRARPLYRQCVDWYAVEHRVAGDTVVPHMRCWWVYR
jgi:hypothetical protein